MAPVICAGLSKGEISYTFLYFQIKSEKMRDKTVFLFLGSAQLLNVNGLHHLLAIGNRGLLKSLTATKFLYDAGFFEFTFEFLECAFDCFAFFYLYDDHI